MTGTRGGAVEGTRYGVLEPVRPCAKDHSRRVRFRVDFDLLHASDRFERSAHSACARGATRLLDDECDLLQAGRSGSVVLLGAQSTRLAPTQLATL
jgi:hypothetical protein